MLGVPRYIQVLGKPLDELALPAHVDGIVGVMVIHRQKEEAEVGLVEL